MEEPYFLLLLGKIWSRAKNERSTEQPTRTRSVPFSALFLMEKQLSRSRTFFLQRRIQTPSARVCFLRTRCWQFSAAELTECHFSVHCGLVAVVCGEKTIPRMAECVPRSSEKSHKQTIFLNKCLYPPRRERQFLGSWDCTFCYIVYLRTLWRCSAALRSSCWPNNTLCVPFTPRKYFPKTFDVYWKSIFAFQISAVCLLCGWESLAKYSATLGFFFFRTMTLQRKEPNIPFLPWCVCASLIFVFSCHVLSSVSSWWDYKYLIASTFFYTARLE